MTDRVQRLSHAVLLGVVVVLLVPLAWPWGSDSFPVSSYPMFARPRAQEVSIPTVVGVRETGERVTLSSQLIGDTRWTNLAVRLVRDTVRAGADASSLLCEQIAARVADSRSDLVALEVVTETFDSVAHLTESAPPTGVRVHARCETR